MLQAHCALKGLRAWETARLICREKTSASQLTRPGHGASRGLSCVQACGIGVEALFLPRQLQHSDKVTSFLFTSFQRL
jgi:hypothetical protein